MKNNRLFSVLYYILEKGQVTANELADKFEVSVRTIYRDIDTLSSTGIPIYTLQGKNGGIKIADDFILTKSLLTKSEREEIMMALQGLERTNNLHESELLTKLSTLFKMKHTNWVEIDFTSWKNNTTYQTLFYQIKSAILTKHILCFSYSSNKEETGRKVKPARLIFKGQDWYLYAFCLLRNDFRYFKLSRIKELEIDEVVFEDDFENISIKKSIEVENMIRVKVKFDKKVAFRVYDELSGEFTEDEAGNLYSYIEIPDDNRLYSYLFSFGDGFEVLEPVELRERIQKILHKLIEKNKT